MRLHFIHDWSKWTTLKNDKGEAKISKIQGDYDLNPTCHIFYQERVCSVCNKKVVRRQKI